MRKEIAERENERTKKKRLNLSLSIAKLTDTTFSFNRACCRIKTSRDGEAVQKFSQQGERDRGNQQELDHHREERRGESQGDSPEAADDHPEVLRRGRPAGDNAAGHLLHPGLEGNAGSRLKLQTAR